VHQKNFLNQKFLGRSEMRISMSISDIKRERC